jgi:thiamine kinase-like enzyme
MKKGKLTDITDIETLIKLCLCNKDVYNFSTIKHGLTNNVYQFEQSRQKYILRITKEETNINIDRLNEYEVIEVLKNKNYVAKKVFFDQESGIAIFKFVEHDSFFNLINKEAIENTIDVLNDLHKIQNTHLQSFDPAALLKTYTKSAIDNNVKINKYLKLGLPKFNKLISKYYNGDTSNFALCHNDLLQQNILLNKNKATIIDWELASMNDEYFDFASLIIESDGYDIIEPILAKKVSGFSKSKLTDFVYIISFLFGM